MDDSGWPAPVPACPGWTIADLVGHLGGVHRNITYVIEKQAGETGRASRSSRHPPEGEDTLREWLRDGGEALLSVLDGDPTTPAWTFDPQNQTLGFWRGRMAWETAIHRVDAEVALNEQTAIPEKLAADGVTEAIEVMVRLGEAEGRLRLPDYAITLRATDTGDAWQLGHGTVAGTASGKAEELLLCCWRRVHPGQALALDGDSSRVLDLLALPLTP